LHFNESSLYEICLEQLPFLAYCTSLRKSSLLSDLVEALFGLAFIAATIRSASALVRVLSLGIVDK